MSKVQLGPRPFLLPQPAVLVGTVVGGTSNFMVAAWCGVANRTPPMVTVAVQPSRYTEAGIEANRSFSLNVPSADLAVKVDHCGIASGRSTDKSTVFTTRTGTVPGAPLIEECPLILECRLVQTVELPTHKLHLGEVVEVHAEEACLVDGVPYMGKVDPLIYSITDRQYWRVGEPVAKAFQAGKQFEP